MPFEGGSQLVNYRDADEAFRTRNYEKAIGLYFEFLRDFPEDFAAWCNLGISLGRMGRPEDALKCFDRALELDPRSADAWHNRGLSLGSLGRREEELECYDRALEINPTYQVSILKKVEVLRVLCREQEANELFREYTNRKRAAIQNVFK
jgi:tetratricopeptide (TPR) repeat protein